MEDSFDVLEIGARHGAQDRRHEAARQ